jgi:hypothetical protein
MSAVTGSTRVTLLACASALVALVAPAVAEADHGERPWSSGPGVESSLEAAAGKAISELIVKRPVQVRCHSEQEWAVANAALGWDPAGVAGFAGVGGTVAELSPDTCFHLDEFWNGGAAQKRCQTIFTAFQTTTTKIPVKLRKKVRVKVKGTWRTRIRTVTVLREMKQEVRVADQRLVQCEEFPQRTHAVQVLAHEAFHLAGIWDEAQTDCYAMQWIGPVGIRLGADPAFAAEMTDWMWSWYQSYQATKPSEYFSPDCREDGPLDLTPGDGRWP